MAHTEETKQKIREALMGHPTSEETRRKIGLKSKGRVAWNKGKSWSKEIREKISLTNKLKGIEPKAKYSAKDEKHPQWKGDEVGYRALHHWIRRKLGIPEECKFCGSRFRIAWASVSHKAKRDVADYIPLCTACHKNYDLSC